MFGRTIRTYPQFTLIVTCHVERVQARLGNLDRKTTRYYPLYKIFCIVLYRIVLYCILYCIVLCIVLYTVLYCILYCIVLYASLCSLIIDIQEICTLNLASIGRPKIISPRFLFGLPTIIEKHLYFIIIYLLLSFIFRLI